LALIWKNVHVKIPRTVTLSNEQIQISIDI